MTLDENRIKTILKDFSIASPFYIDVHATRFKQTLELIPNPKKQGRCLDLGSFFEFAVLMKECGFNYELFINNKKTSSASVEKHTLVNSKTRKKYQFNLYPFDVEKDPFPFEDEYFDLVICCELLEHLRHDPMFMMSEINRVLKKNATLLLSTPNVASYQSVKQILMGDSPYLYGPYKVGAEQHRHNREYTPKEITLLLEDSGFRIEKLTTKDLYNQPDPKTKKLLQSLDASGEQRGEVVFALARKDSPIKNRYPLWLYDYEGTEEEAITDFRAKMSKNEQQRTHQLLGAIYDKKGLPNKAIKEFEKALYVDKKDAETHYLLGMSHKKKEQLKKASQELRLAIELDSVNISAYQALIQCLEQDINNLVEQIGQKDSSIQTLEEHIKKLDKQIGNLQAETKENQQSIQEMQTEIKNNQQTIQEKDAHIRNLEADLNRIRSTLAYRLYKRLKFRRT